MSNLTAEQLAAVESRGKVIVSASAGSGKTFVMIEKNSASKAFAFKSLAAASSEDIMSNPLSTPSK